MTHFERYARQMALPGFGAEGQRALGESLVLVVGAGGVGCGALPLLAASGVGKIAIVDGDTVSESNLHRQTLYSPGQIGAMKARAAADALSTLNPDCEISYYARFFEDSDEFCALVESASVCIDATDSFCSRGVVSTVCERVGKPEIFASAQGYVAQNAAFGGGFYLGKYAGADTSAFSEGARALPIFPPAAHLAGVWAAAAAIGHISKALPLKFGEFRIFDFSTCQFRKFDMSRA